MQSLRPFLSRFPAQSPTDYCWSHLSFEGHCSVESTNSLEQFFMVIGYLSFPLVVIIVFKQSKLDYL